MAKENQGRNPYLNNLEDGEERVKENEDFPSPSFAPSQTLINSCLALAP